MSLELTITRSKAELDTCLLTIPEGVAELADYELWGTDFLIKLVRISLHIARHPYTETRLSASTRLS
jgi:hypothetical protein